MQLLGHHVSSIMLIFLHILGPCMSSSKVKIQLEKRPGACLYLATLVYALSLLRIDLLLNFASSINCLSAYEQLFKNLHSANPQVTF